MRIWISMLVLLGSISIQAQTHVEPDLERSRKYILYKVNEIRTNGCRCGGERLKATHKLMWSETLTASARAHATEMDEYNFFGHRSLDGKDIGDRLDDFDYPWQYVGENLAEGQDNFEEALEDWLESDSHCRMIMNPDMKEMGMAKVGKYWVHHFGTRMPKHYKRTRTYYKEG